ncbi:MAG: hypothetical protein RLY20_75 [Verrucomicrobiota bacterium]|jgi:hypothetical protein
MFLGFNRADGNSIYSGSKKIGYDLFRPRLKARNIQCYSNLKQVVLGITLFACQKDDLLPYETQSNGTTPVSSIPLSLDAANTYNPVSRLRMAMQRTSCSSRGSRASCGMWISIPATTLG